MEHMTFLVRIGVKPRAPMNRTCRTHRTHRTHSTDALLSLKANMLTTPFPDESPSALLRTDKSITGDETAEKPRHYGCCSGGVVGYCSSANTPEPCPFPCRGGKGEPFGPEGERSERSGCDDADGCSIGVWGCGTRGIGGYCNAAGGENGHRHLRQLFVTLVFGPDGAVMVPQNKLERISL